MASGGLVKKIAEAYLRGDNTYLFAKYMGIAGDPSNTGMPGYGPYKKPRVYDNGGYLAPGLHMTGSFTGRERVLSPAETAAYERGGSGGPKVVVNVHTQEINPRKHAADLGWEIAQRIN
jgi:hypothetical protein